VSWIETCNHSKQNQSRQGESQTENLWHSRPETYLRYDVVAAWVTNWTFYLHHVMRGGWIVTTFLLLHKRIKSEDIKYLINNNADLMQVNLFWKLEKDSLNDFYFGINTLRARVWYIRTSISA